MLLQPVIDQVTATAGVGFLSGGFRKVMGAAGFADAQADLKVPPVAYVIPLGDTAQPNQLQGLSIEQHVIERFGVIIAASNVRDVRGEAVNTATTYGYDSVTMMQETKTTMCQVAKA